LRNRTLIFAAFFGLTVLEFFGASAMAQSVPPSFPHYNFDVGGGVGIGRGAVGQFVGNSNFAMGGGGINVSRLFGFSAEYMYYDMGIRPSVRQSQNLNNTSGSLNTWSLNTIVRPPLHYGRLGTYGIFGVGFYRRAISSSTGLVRPGAVCQPAWVWWEIYCVNGYTQFDQYLGSNVKVAGGYNFGGGITYPTGHFHNSKLFVEFRYHKAYTSDIKTVMWPITVGLRW
jgi:hypothetical protein